MPLSWSLTVFATVAEEEDEEDEEEDEEDEEEDEEEEEEDREEEEEEKEGDRAGSEEWWIVSSTVATITPHFAIKAFPNSV